MIADIGTGSGCIAVALAKELPGANIYADRYFPRRSRCRTKKRRPPFGSGPYQLSRIRLIAAVPSWLRQNDRGVSNFDLLVSNPPYMARRDANTLAPEVRDHEPAIALYGGEEGYELYASLVALAAQHLKPGGIFIAELGHDSLPAVQRLLDSNHWTPSASPKTLPAFPASSPRNDCFTRNSESPPRSPFAKFFSRRDGCRPLPSGVPCRYAGPRTFPRET